MSRNNILITGASGYLGGTLLNRLKTADLPAHNAIFALVRTSSQAEAVKQYGAKALTFDAYNAEAVKAAVLKYELNIVFALHDAFKSDSQANFIEALGELRKTGKEVHFLHTTGAKMFSSHVGAPIDEPFADNDGKLYEIQKGQRAPMSMLQIPIETNNTLIELSESLGVRSYIFIPCIVYGKGEGFGNPISIQTVAIVDAARAANKVYRVDQDRPIWPVCHVVDNANLYIQLLRNILSGKKQGHGKIGYYLASPGSVAWDDIYATMAKSLHKRGVISDDSVSAADDVALDKMANGLGCDKEMVSFQLGGKCFLTAKHGQEIGWQPQYTAEHIFSALDEEVN